MLNISFEEVRVDTVMRTLIGVVPSAEYVERFRLDGLERREDGVRYVRKAPGGALS